MVPLDVASGRGKVWTLSFEGPKEWAVVDTASGASEIYRERSTNWNELSSWVASIVRRTSRRREKNCDNPKAASGSSGNAARSAAVVGEYGPKS